MSIKSLIINPGSTSTKIAVFEDETMLFDKTLRHTNEEIAQFDSIIAQKDFRKNIILDFLKEQNFDIKSLNVCVGRGGLVKPIPGGTYIVNDALRADLEKGVQGQHELRAALGRVHGYLIRAVIYEPNSMRSDKSPVVYVGPFVADAPEGHIFRRI